MTFASHVIAFYDSLKFNHPLPKSCEVLLPYRQEEVKKSVKAFYTEYYSDNRKRLFIFGINPGRFGAGVTGIPFTDPVRLSEVCGIKHHFENKPELSSVFIYQAIQAYGGIKKFCTDFYLTAVCPLGFTRDAKNMNYYDDRKFQASLKNFIVSNIKKQMAFGTTKQACICLGQGKNYEFLSAINEKEKFFSNIVALPHPRWVMQYRRKKMTEFVMSFIDTLKELKPLIAV